MDSKHHVLMIGTCGIDCFYGLDSALTHRHIEVHSAQSTQDVHQLLQQQAFKVILINLEPDGNGGIEGIELIEDIIADPKQKNAVCFSISTRSACDLLASGPINLKKLAVIAGWLNLPTQPEKASKIMHEIIDNPGKLTISQRLGMC